MNFSEAATGGVFWRKPFLKISQYTQEYWKDIPTQVFSSEYCEIFKSTYFQQHLLTAGSVFFLKQLQNTEEQLLTGVDSFIKFR